ncbi:MAG: 30S ribosomal protein S6 [Pirellulaceae bacterium]
MSKNVYECMLILDSNRYAKDPQGVSGKVPELVEKCGGEVLVSRLWVEQKLAYPIEGHRKGTYWMTYFRLEGDNITQFNRECQLSDNILRHLVLKVDPRLVDTLVAHARGESTAPSEGEGGETGEASDGEKTEGEEAKDESSESKTEEAASTS